MNAIWSIVMVAVGGFAGSITRYLIGSAVDKRFPSSMPYGTLTINMSGSFLLGLMHGAHSATALLLLFGTGFLGAYTTFSTMKLESMRLSQSGRTGMSAVYLTVTYTLGLACAYGGYAAGSAIGGY